MLKEQTRLNIKRFRKDTRIELIVENIITGILRGKGMFVEQYIPLILIERYVEREYGIKLSERQIRYNVDKLIMKRKLERRIEYATIKGKIIKRGYYRIYPDLLRKKISKQKTNLSRNF